MRWMEAYGLNVLAHRTDISHDLNIRQATHLHPPAQSYLGLINIIIMIAYHRKVRDDELRVLALGT
jgi:hypothetical protein